MFSKFEFFVALRYLRSRRQERFISVTAIFSFVGIALGVATLIVVMSVMNGFRKELVRNIIGINAHLSIFPKDGDQSLYGKIIEDLSGNVNIETINPLVENQVMVVVGDRAVGGIAKAIQLKDLKSKKRIYESLGNVDNFDDSNNIIIGKQMAIMLNLEVGNNIKLVSPETDTTIFGTIPRIKTYTIVGVFGSGMYEYDSAVVFIPFVMGQKQFRYDNAANVIEIYLKNPDNSMNSLYEFRDILKNKYNFNIIDWKDANSSLISALNVEKNVMFLILTLIIIIATFNIISSLIMLVMDKNKQIAILKTIGVTKGGIMKIFFICGTTIGFMGTILGAVAGSLFAFFIEDIKHLVENIFGVNLFNPTVYFLSQLPSEVSVPDIVTVMAMSMLLSFLATLYPAFKASKTNPIDTLRYE
ncbi:MAG: lipoprotein-releasing ABC transporter permease subunit [Rickettsiales bacterium]|jgi:lipoprotein-releasing system permease protein|nr:lipoprotein-releasing ABC transporter permease subunit [Rickettsiales bacterium]